MFSYQKGGKYSGFISLLSKGLEIHGVETWQMQEVDPSPHSELALKM